MNSYGSVSRVSESIYKLLRYMNWIDDSSNDNKNSNKNNDNKNNNNDCNDDNT